MQYADFEELEKNFCIQLVQKNADDGFRRFLEIWNEDGEEVLHEIVRLRNQFQ